MEDSALDYRVQSVQNAPDRASGGSLAAGGEGKTPRPTITTFLGAVYGRSVWARAGATTPRKTHASSSPDPWQGVACREGARMCGALEKVDIRAKMYHSR